MSHNEAAVNTEHWKYIAFLEDASKKRGKIVVSLPTLWLSERDVSWFIY